MYYVRLPQRFYWTSMRRDVAEYCRSCGACQKFSQRKPACVPMVPLPVVDEPSSRVAMDLVDPFPRSRSGNRYVFVMCDYATRYSDAVPLRNIDAYCRIGALQRKKTSSRISQPCIFEFGFLILYICFPCNACTLF